MLYMVYPKQKIYAKPIQIQPQELPSTTSMYAWKRAYCSGTSAMWQ